MAVGVGVKLGEGLDSAVMPDEGEAEGFSAVAVIPPCCVEVQAVNTTLVIISIGN